MGVVYICSKFEEDDIYNIFSDPNKVSYAANKYNSLLSAGLSFAVPDVEILGMIPVTRANCKKRLIPCRKLYNGKAAVHYLTTVNIPYIKNLLRIIQVFFRLLFAKKGTAVIFDIFQKSACIGMYFASKIRGHKMICLLTDLPQYVCKIGEECKVDFMTNKILNNSNGYILLTEQMKEHIPDEKPGIVIEGLTDAENVENEFEKYDEKVVLYAGSLHKEFGVADLIDAFISCRKKGEKLYLYGAGNYVDEIKRISESDPDICYFGVAPNSEIVKSEKKATLLVNPRINNGKYTEYSFPSKVMEYFSAGTPVLMAELPGIPKEYYQYCYSFNDTGPDTLKNVLRTVLDKPENELAEKGKEAARFVIESKNYKAQATRVVEFFKL